MTIATKNNIVKTVKTVKNVKNVKNVKTKETKEAKEEAKEHSSTIQYHLGAVMTAWSDFQFYRAFRICKHTVVKQKGKMPAAFVKKIFVLCFDSLSKISTCCCMDQCWHMIQDSIMNAKLNLEDM